MQNVLNELQENFSNDQIKTDSDSLKSYGNDWTHFFTPSPLAILFPKTTEEVQKIVLWARKNKIALVPSGGRTGLSAAAVAKNGEVVVSMEKMNQIGEYNPVDQTIECEAGVITETLQEHAKAQGAFYPVDFAARGSSHIGGNIATNAGGIKVLRYGLTRQWVAALEVVTGTGEILKLNNSLVKNASGYDFRHLFIGSEGTLGFITKAVMRVAAPPKNLQVMVLGVPDMASIMKVFARFRDDVALTAFELFTDKALKHVLAQGHVQKPFETPCPYYVLIEFEELTENSIDEALSVFEKCVEEEWVLDGVISQSETQSKDFWRLREDITEATDSYTPYKNDISVKISRVPEFIEAIDKIFAKEYPNFEVVWFGHIGDGNLHINILKPRELSMEDFVADCNKVNDILFSTIQDFGGSISAEHGVGLTKKPYLHFTRSREEIELMKSVKKIFDPDGLLNPGKVFDL